MPPARPLPDIFDPAVTAWFAEAFPQGPTDVQLQAWPAIAAGGHTLIAAPTGSGKTLAAFLAVLDRLMRDGGGQGTRVVYVSPLKALGNDVEKNLRAPLRGIDAKLAADGRPEANLRAAVRSGDTPQSARQAMVRNPPDILVTTPESLYLLLTSDGGRNMLRTVETVIVDEIHALVQDRRGSHLSLTLERLDALCERPVQRIGLSATQKPIETVAAFLTGCDDRGEPRPCTIIDAGFRRKLDVAIELPDAPLGPVMEGEAWADVCDRICAMISEHRTTLIFVNTRRMAERLAHMLSERMDPDQVAAHHGSLSKENRLLAEQRLKQGTLQALVATASLELGIDIGDLDLVIQIGSPRAIATFLQRVGRARHQVFGTPKGRLIPQSIDDLAECTALLYAVRQGWLDTLDMPEAPIDILAQQIVAEVACGERDEAELLAIFRRAWPYRQLDEETFGEVAQMLADGFTLRRGRSGAWIHRDRIHGRLRPRRGARLVALTCGGSIPDTFEFDVVLEPGEVVLGRLDEEFSLESLPGDIIQLGNHSWRLLGVVGDQVRVADAGDAPPTIPFWFGEGPGRTLELSEAVSAIREGVAQRLVIGGSDDAPTLDTSAAVAWLVEQTGVSADVAEELSSWIGTTRLMLGTVPTMKRVIAERFFDEAGDQHLVIHSPFGMRVNRAWGFALRKRFCRTFNFELQAAATDNAILLSLGSTHSFVLADVWQFLSPQSARDILVQAILDAPMFEIRWRWNASRALAIRRMQNGKRRPPQLQRMDAEDLVALVFPDQLACLENIAGDREIPDHPLVNQTIADCLHEAMDIETLERILEGIRSGAIETHEVDLTEPSPFAQEVIFSRPYQHLDGEEERRTDAIRTRRWFDAAAAASAARLDPQAVTRVRDEAWPGPVRNADDLHDALLLAGFLSDREIRARGDATWPNLLDTLQQTGRAVHHPHGFWYSAERAGDMRLALGDDTLPAPLPPAAESAEVALRELVRSRLEVLGPTDAAEIAGPLPVDRRQIETALLALEQDGFAMQGRYLDDVEGPHWCDRRLLARAHRYSLQKRRAEIEPVSVQDFWRFLTRWHGLTSDMQGRDSGGVEQALERLCMWEAPAVAWEQDLLPARVADYDPTSLDGLTLSGAWMWLRIPGEQATRGPVRTTPVIFAPRADLASLLPCADRPRPEDADAERLLRAFEQYGAQFVADLQRHSGLLPSRLEAALALLVAGGWVTADSAAGLRALLTPSHLRPAGRKTGSRRSRDLERAGRWSLIDTPDQGEADIEAWVDVLLQRYGVVCRTVVARERLAPRWRDIVMALRRREVRGLLRGGYFVRGLAGEQYALPEAVGLLKRIRRDPPCGELVSLTAADPLNLIGIVTDGALLPALAGNRFLLRDGEPIAVLTAGEVRFLTEVAATDHWRLEQALRRQAGPAPGAIARRRLRH